MRLQSVVYLSGLLITLAGLFWLSSWWGATTQAFTLQMTEPAQGVVYLQWRPDEPPLPLVPANDANALLGELPPRPQYVLRLTFPLSERPPEFTLHFRPLPGQAPSLQPVELGRYLTDEGWVVRYAPLTISAGIVPPITLLLLLFAAALILAGFILSLKAPAKAAAPSTPPKQTLRVLGLSLGLGLLHVLLVTGAHPDFFPDDSTTYLWKAVHILEQGSYDTGAYEYEINRLPGVPLLWSLALRLFGFSLGSIILWQSCLYVLAVTSLACLLRQRLPLAAVLVLLCFAYFSPPLVWSMSLAASEPWFIFGTLACLASMLRWQAANGMRAWIGALVFGILVVATCFMRPNGIVLLGLPLFWLVGQMRLRGLRIELRSALPQALLPTALVAVALLAWSQRNAETRGVFAPTDLGPVAQANAPFITGMLEPQALLAHEGLYPLALRQRAANGFFFHGWHIRHHLFVEITENYAKRDISTLPKLNAALDQFNHAQSAEQPLGSKLTAYLRCLGWALWFAPRHNHAHERLMPDYLLKAELSNHTRNNIHWVSEKFELQPVELGFLQRLYNRMAPHYIWVFRLLSIAGLGAFFVAALRGWQGPLFFFLPYYANILLNVAVQNVIGRYTQVLDGLLLIGILLTLARCFQPQSYTADRTAR